MPLLAFACIPLFILRKPWMSMKMHRVPVDNFIIYYAVNNDSLTVTVIRIFYGGRDVGNIVNAKRK